ncbi:uncharacterized protein [Gossypium hirsutum]|uniref:CCHC-type domain-containing protein n=1 Tax=Gossypium hirsutum TaxID=3635 RepID=A0A1U8MUP8_GOSHI|nr:uncharacterized protein LOC107941486 [Gossypium hirsutum]
MSDRPEGAGQEEEVNSRIQISKQGTNEYSKSTPIEKLRKFRAEEFRGRSNDDPVKAEYWLKSLERVFKQMMCSPEDYLRCAVSLLKEEAYSWWETIEAVVPADKLTWEFFQNKFKKKYMGKRYLDKKKREFLDLRQGNKTVVEYEREFVYLSRYARDVVPTEEEMCIRFKEELNDEIRMMIRGTEIRKFVGKIGACYRCGGADHFIRDCSQLLKEDREQGEKQANTPKKSKRLGQSSAAGTAHLGTRDTVTRLEIRAPARTYAIRAREEASAPDSW